MIHKTKTTLSLAAAMGTLALAASSANAAVILADNFDGVVKSGNTATFTTWDTINGLDSTASSLSFVDPGNSDAALAFFNVTANEIDVNENIGNGGEWKTSFVLDLSAGTASIDLTTLNMTVRLTNGSGGTQTDTTSKDGRYTVQIQGSSSGDLGSQTTVTPNYTALTAIPVSVDLSSFANLDQTETYTVNLSVIRNNGSFGHHVSLQDLTLNGDITAIPEPSTTALLGLGGLALILRRRK